MPKGNNVPRRAAKRCTRCGRRCTASPCNDCETRRQGTVDHRRGTPTQRGYTGTGHRKFHNAVLARDPTCTCTGCRRCTHPARCVRESTQADHHPATRRQLAARGANPNDPDHGRGLCGPCHSHSTASTDGGFGNPRR